MVIGISPALIMALVGSLCFFLIDVFYRGQMLGSVRWVMFWFVLAIVLVARIAIENSPESAAVYGACLAASVWLYLAKTAPNYCIASLVLLAIIWYCAHKLVWDCTLIDEDDDSSGHGLLQSPPPAKSEPKPPASAKPKAKAKRKWTAPSSPGLSVVYFSLAALPLFGIGQSLLPANAADLRRKAVVFVVLYMSAALGLLVTTSFLGLRRYLRQRYLRMPAAVALSWLKLGGGVAFVILALALFLPRPGASQAWTALRYQIDYRLRQASRYASKKNPPGQGDGRAGNTPAGQKGESPAAGSQPNTQTAPAPAGTAPPSAASPSGPVPAEVEGGLYKLLRTTLLIVAGLMGAWWLFRCRHLLLEIARAIAAAIMNFLRELLDLAPARRPARPSEPAAPRSRLRPFSEYKNPFFSGEDYLRSPAEIIIYTFEFTQAWAREHGIELHPEQTPREFCRDMAARSPELASCYRHLSYLYAYAAYGKRVPPHCDMDPLKELWRQLTWEHANAPAT